jgi:hypothetical protein
MKRLQGRTNRLKGRKQSAFRRFNTGGLQQCFGVVTYNKLPTR